MTISLKKSGGFRKILGIIIVIFLLFFVLNYFQKDVRNFFYSSFSPIQKVFFRVGDRVHNFFEALASAKRNYKDLEELKIQNQGLISQLVQLQELRKENETLRQALNLGLEKEFKLILTQVVGKYVSQDFILVDKGTKDGVAKNMPVITDQKVLVGRVSEVYEKFSKITLISCPDTYFDAKIAEKDITAIVKGRGNYKILFDLIPREEEIASGDIIVSSGSGGIFPDGLLVGTVKEIKKSDLEAFQQAIIDPFFNLKETNTIFLIAEY